jgi:hypothetical protein
MVSLYPVFVPGIHVDSPNGAGFDSPGRQPWEDVKKEPEAPKGARLADGEFVWQTELIDGKVQSQNRK